MSADECLGGRALHEGARLVIDLRSEKVVGRRVADLELDRRVEFHELDEIWVTKIAALRRRYGRQGLGAQRGDRSQRRDAKLVRPRLRLDVAPRETHAGRDRLGRSTALISREHDPFAVVQPIRWKGKGVARNFREWVRKEPFDQRPQAAIP